MVATSSGGSRSSQPRSPPGPDPGLGAVGLSWIATLIPALDVQPLKQGLPAPISHLLTPSALGPARDRPPPRPRVRPWGRRSRHAPGDAPCPGAARDVSAPFPKALQILDVKPPLKTRMQPLHANCCLFKPQSKNSGRCYPRVAALHASRVPGILKGSAFRPVSTPPQCNVHFYQGSCLMAPINFDF